MLTRRTSSARSIAQYLAAGADIIETNTFNAQAMSQADYGLEPIAYELNLAAARLARAAADEWTAKKPRRRGSSPARWARPIARCRFRRTSTTRRFARSRSTSWGRRIADQVRGLIDGGVDLLLVETIFDTLNAKAAIVAIDEVFEEKRRRAAADDLGDDHRSQRPDAVGPDARCVLPVDRARAAVQLGLNCALGAREMRPYLAELARLADGWVSCYPNAGLPNAFGQYDELPEETGALLREFADQRLRQHHRRLLRHDAGSHSRRLRRRSRTATPRRPADSETGPRIGRFRVKRSITLTRFSGLEPLTSVPTAIFR